MAENLLQESVDHLPDEQEIEAQLRRQRGDPESGKVICPETAVHGGPGRVLDEGEIETRLLRMREERGHCLACGVQDPASRLSRDRS
jgi:hypothetical protein